MSKGLTYLAAGLKAGVKHLLPGMAALILAGCMSSDALQQHFLARMDENGGAQNTAVALVAPADTTRQEASLAAEQPPATEPRSRTASSTLRTGSGRKEEASYPSLAALRKKIDAAFTPSSPPVAQRQRLSEQLTRKVLAGVRLVKDDALNKRLQGIMERLKPAALAESAYPASWQLHVIDSNRADAFTSGGGHIFITRGMIDLLGTDERIATVIAHEMAHNVLAHVWAAREKKELARKAHRFSRDVLARQMNMPWLGKSVSFLVTTSLNTYSRQQEYDADAIGLHLLVQAGYRPQAALETFDQLKRHFREESGFKNFFHSHHPLYQRRRWYLANRIRAYYRKQAGLPAVRRANWK